MTYSDLSALVQKRASQAYSDLQAACEVASSILAEHIEDGEREERVKAVFMAARD